MTDCAVATQLAGRFGLTSGRLDAVALRLFRRASTGGRGAAGSWCRCRRCGKGAPTALRQVVYLVLRNYKASEQRDAHAWRRLTVLWPRNWPGGFVSCQNGSTPLHVASQNGHLPVVAALLERGAEVDAANKVRKQRGDGSCTLFGAIIKRPSSAMHMPGGV